jgi:hypothetical protein
MRLRRRGEALEGEPGGPAASSTARASEAPRGPAATTGVGEPARGSAPAASAASSRQGDARAGAPVAARRRRTLGWRTRDAGAAAVGSVGAGVMLLARLVMALATLIALLIALAVVLRDVDANPANTIVKGIHEGANFFAGAFTGLLTFKGHAKRELTIDWGIALIVYLLLGAFVARMIASVGRGGLRFERSHRAAASH